MSSHRVNSHARFINVACNCILAAVVSGLLSALMLMGIVLLLTSYALAAV